MNSPTTNVFRRLFWLATIVIGVFYSFYMIKNNTMRYFTYPTQIKSIEGKKFLMLSKIWRKVIFYRGGPSRISENNDLFEFDAFSSGDSRKFSKS